MSIFSGIRDGAGVMRLLARIRTLTSRLGVRYVQGLQGHDENYLKAAACAKHFAVHSGPESLRHEFDAVVTKQDMRETYLP